MTLKVGATSESVAAVGAARAVGGRLLDDIGRSEACGGVGGLLRGLLELGASCAPDAPAWVGAGLSSLLSRSIASEGGLDAALAVLLPVDASDAALAHIADLLVSVPVVRACVWAVAVACARA